MFKFVILTKQKGILHKNSIVFCATLLVTKMLQGYYKTVTKVLQNGYKGVAKRLQMVTDL